MRDCLKIKEWSRWIEEIHKQIRKLLWNRHIFRKVREIIKTNPNMPKQNKFYGFLRDSYGAVALMAIRRQIKTGNKSISFAKLLEEIRNNHKNLSRKRLINLYKESKADKNLASEEFDEYVGKGKSYVDPDKVRSELDELRQKSKKIETIVDKTLAHHDEGGININNITFEEIDECIDFLKKHVKKYYFLIHGVHKKYMHELPSDEWMAIFKAPWLH